jgi:hypothetical protein
MPTPTTCSVACRWSKGICSKPSGPTRKAAELTPGSVTRLQHAGRLAFYAGNAADALDLLDRACRMGVKSRLFDPLALVLLVMLHFDSRDGKALCQMQSHLGRLL